MDPNLLVGHIGVDDAGVYRIDDERAMVLTVDFFTPVVDDPYDYGRVAAANSFSDVYAMGGRPVVALNIAAFPEKELSDHVIADILRGGADVAKAAGVVIVGGHTVSDHEIKYGLSVVGMIHPEEIVQNSGAGPGDALVLTKPIGTGVLTTALKAGDLPEAQYGPLIDAMTTLNRDGSEAMRRHGVTACTDVTGNALFGHAFEMADASDVTIEIELARVPLLPGAKEAVARGHLTAGGGKNRRYIGESITWDCEVNDTLENLGYDPQTSGGLLITVPAEEAEALVARLRTTYPQASVIGRVSDRGKTRLRVV